MHLFSQILTKTVRAVFSNHCSNIRFWFMLDKHCLAIYSMKLVLGLVVFSACRLAAQNSYAVNPFVPHVRQHHSGHRLGWWGCIPLQRWYDAAITVITRLALLLGEYFFFGYQIRRYWFGLYILVVWQSSVLSWSHRLQNKLSVLSVCVSYRSQLSRENQWSGDSGHLGSRWTFKVAWDIHLVWCTLRCSALCIFQYLCWLSAYSSVLWPGRCQGKASRLRCR